MKKLQSCSISKDSLKFIKAGESGVEVVNYDLMSSVVKSFNEMRSGTVRNML